MGKIVGIDLGTTKSVISIYENGHPVIYQNTKGDRITPSYVALKKTGEWIVGKSAKNQAMLNPLNTIYGAKRLIGRRFDEDEVKKMQALVPYKIVPGPQGDAYIEINGKAMSPVEVGAMVLGELKKAVEQKIGEPVTEAVITVPAYFNNSQRQATKDAGKIAGLDVKRIINEPTAAALAYGLDKKKSGKIAVYDLGGGTFDVSILDLSQIDGQTMLEVKATNGNTFLGGENFDEKISEMLIKKINAECGVDINTRTPEEKTKYATQLQRIREASEKAKIDLSSQLDTEIALPFLMTDKDGAPVNFTYTMSRKELEDLLDDLIRQTIPPFKKSLEDAKLTLADIDEVLMVGAQTRMPRVVEIVKEFTGKTPRQDVPPDEIVAQGAAVQGSIIQGGVDNVLLLDVIPLSIGIKTKGDVMDVMIPRNATIPTEKKDLYTTAVDNQRDVDIQVFQGERPIASQNKLLGRFTLDGIPPAKATTPQIEVSFSIDADGVLNVSAKDLKRPERVQKITIKANGGLSEAEVNAMLKDAELNKAKDDAIRAQSSAEAAADYEQKEAEKDMKEDYFTSAPQDLQDEFKKIMTELTEARTKKETATIVEKTQALSAARTKLGEAFNGAAPAPAPDATPAPQPEAASKDGPKTPPAAPPAAPGGPGA
jgi:molecular chaperone DnaK